MSRRGWLLFVSLCLIWGVPYLLIRVAVREISPPALVFLRTAPAALLLLPLAARQGRAHGLRARWPWVVAFAVCETAVPWLLLSHAEQRITSSLAGLLIAAVPLIGVALYPLAGHDEHYDTRRLAGLVVGFGGVVALVGLDVGRIDTLALLEMLGVACGYAVGPLIVSKWLADLPSLWVVGVSLALTALVYAPFGISRFPDHVSGQTLGSVITLALVCTALAFYLFFALIREVGPARSTVITYINPAVAILGGVLILGEPLTTGMAVGFPLVVVGSLLSTARSAH